MVVRVLSGYDCIRSIPISHHALVFGPFGGWAPCSPAAVPAIIDGCWTGFPVDDNVWVNYNISLTWIEAIWGWWGRSEVVIIYPDNVPYLSYYIMVTDRIMEKKNVQLRQAAPASDFSIIGFFPIRVQNIPEVIRTFFFLHNSWRWPLFPSLIFPVKSRG